MSDVRDEVRTSLRCLIENMKVLAEKNPGMQVPPADFNSLLDRAKKAFPELATVQEMGGIETTDGMTNIGTVLMKASILQGPVDQAQRVRAAAAVIQPRPTRWR